MRLPENTISGPMHLKRRSLTVSSVLLSSLIAAVVTHVVLQHALVSDVHPLGGYAHESLGPVASFAAAALAATLAYLMMFLARPRTAIDPLVALAADVSRTSPFVATLATFGGASFVLVAMESYERVRAFGHIAHAVGAVNGSGIACLFVTFVVAAIVACGGLRFARAIVASAVRAARLLLAWNVLDAPACGVPNSPDNRARVRTAALIVVATLGMRGPPNGIASRS